MTINDMLEIAPYSLPHKEKRDLLLPIMRELMTYHQQNSDAYSAILRAEDMDASRAAQLEDVPFLPVSLFKDCDLLSVPREQITKVMTSSGTTGQRVSQVFLDAETSKNQSRVLSKIIASFVGEHRLPMLVLDSRMAIRDYKLLSARGAGIMGFSVFGKNTVYALDDNMDLDVDAVMRFVEAHRGKKVLLFGYTFMIWKHFYLALKEKGVKFELAPDSILFHVGGWKKLKDLAVDGPTFRASLREQTGITHIYDYYGMAEQLGSIFVACEEGHMHASIYSEVITRNPRDFMPCAYGETGILQVMSVIPHSYPGFSLLTEDEGIVLGEDDCPCGRKGRYFRILGRLKNAEIRGCSDTYASKF